LGTGLPNGLLIKRTGHNPPRGPSAGWWVLTAANAAGTNGLTCYRSTEKLEIINFWSPITHHHHPMTDKRCLTSAIPRRSARPSSYSTHTNSMPIISIVPISFACLGQDDVVYNVCGYFIYMFNSLVWCPVKNKRIAPLLFFHGCRKRRLKD
jgi:hypothetical protein